jgi:thiol:disulfide interchange protein DsbD
MKQLQFFICLLFVHLSAFSQIQEPVKWKSFINDSGEIIFSTNIHPGWHLYTIDMPLGGPTPTSFIFEALKGAELVGKTTTLTATTTQFDDLFGMNVSWYKENPTFTQKLKITNPEQFSIKGYIDYMTCNDESCIPGQEEFSFSKDNLPAALFVVRTKIRDEKTKEEPKENEDTLLLLREQEFPEDTIKEIDFWKPVIAELQNFGEENQRNDNSWLSIFLLCFAGGFIALLTPCVWPIIPMTVSFFLKKSKSDRKKAIADAIIYGLAIIVIYLGLGLLITIIFGASALNDLSTSAVFNIIFCVLLILFACAFFGAFDLALPASWVNKMDKKAESTAGLLGIFFMAFTLVLVSFSCTGPIIGSLLVRAVSLGSIMGPAIGMFGFGLALAIPFAFFAIFPSLLQNLPKSGGWLNSVKVVLGFLELAFALKFLSVADLAYGWGILDREVFLVLWIIIFTLLGIYLLGKIKFKHDSDLQYLSVPRLFLAIASFSFAMYMVPGLWGAPLKAISAFPPPLYTQDFNLYDGEVHPQFLDFDEGMEYAKKHNKPVLVDFTGYGCVNCREMEAAVWSDPRVKQLIDNHFVLISLYVDDKTKLPEPIEVEEFGKIRKLRTVGDKWSYLQRSKFGANAQPFYVLLDNQGMPIAAYRAYNKNINEYIDWLKSGLEVFQQK